MANVQHVLGTERQRIIKWVSGNPVEDLYVVNTVVDVDDTTGITSNTRWRVVGETSGFVDLDESDITGPGGTGYSYAGG